MFQNQLSHSFSATIQYLIASILGPVQTRPASLKHTVTIDGHQYASKYTVNQMRQRYHLRYQKKDVSITSWSTLTASGCMLPLPVAVPGTTSILLEAVRSPTPAGSSFLELG